MSEKRPNLKKLAYMLAVYSNSTIPQTYMNEMSNYELLLSLLEKVNNIIERCDNYDKIINEIINYLNTLDDEVLEYLNELKDSPEFKAMLAEVSADYFADAYNRLKEELDAEFDDFQEEVQKELDIMKGKSSIIDFERCCRILKETAHFMATQPAISSPADDTRTRHYSFLQGSNGFTHNGVGYIAMIFIPNDGTKFCEGGSDYDGSGLLEIRYANGTLIKSITIPNVVGHGQCIAYHNGYLYFEGTDPRDSDAGRKLRRISFDFQNNSNVDTFILPYAFNGIASYDGTLYITNATENEIDVSIVDMQSDNVTPTGTVSGNLIMNPPNIGLRGGTTPRNSTVFSAGFSVTKDYYYFGTHKPTGIIRCKRNYDSEGNETRFTIDWYYNIPYMLNNQDFKTGELEGITVSDNGNCLICTTQHINTKAVAQHDITQIFIQNLFDNHCIPYDTQNPYTGRTNIYIDAHNAEHMNADGKSWNTAFRTTDEACWWFNNSPRAGYGHFYFRGNSIYTAFCVNGKTYYFDGSDNAYTDVFLTEGDTSTSMTLIGNLIGFGGTIHLYQIRCMSTIHYLANSTASATTEQNIASYKWQKRNPIYLTDCLFTSVNSGSTYSNNPNVWGAYYIRNCSGIYNISSDAYNMHWYTENNWITNKYYFMWIGSCNINFSDNVHEYTAPLMPDQSAGDTRRKVVSDANGYNLAS